MFIPAASPRCADGITIGVSVLGVLDRRAESKVKRGADVSLSSTSTDSEGDWDGVRGFCPCRNETSVYRETSERLVEVSPCKSWELLSSILGRTRRVYVV